MRLLMITGLGSAIDLASDKKSAFYYTLEEFHKYWDRIDIVVPKVGEIPSGEKVFFGNVHLHVSGLPLLLHPFYFVWKCLQLHREQKFNLMTVQEFPPFYNGIGARIIHALSGPPYVLEIMHIPGLPRAANVKESVYKWLTRIFIAFDARSARAVRVINQRQTREFLIKSGVSENKIVYIPAFYIDLDVFKPSASKKEYDLVFVGRLAENKGVELFLEVIKKSGLKGLIVGDGPLRHKIKSQIESENLKVEMHGWAKGSSEIARLLNHSKVLVMPSYNEGGPRVVLEAMACGVPVLATPVGIVPDVVKDGETGYIIDWDSDEIVKKAELLLQSDSYAGCTEKCRAIAGQFEKVSSIKNYVDKLKVLT